MLLSAVYGSPDALDRKGLWQRISVTSESHDLLWLLMGDFNQVLSADEKSSRRCVNLSNCRKMLDCLQYSNLVDLGASGPKVLPVLKL